MLLSYKKLERNWKVPSSDSLEWIRYSKIVRPQRIEYYAMKTYGGVDV
jgi:hypothetical protein